MQLRFEAAFKTATSFEAALAKFGFEAAVTKFSSSEAALVNFSFEAVLNCTGDGGNGWLQQNLPLKQLLQILQFEAALAN